MLDAQTKRRIDNARDILVGKVPDPKSQVEQITFALIYKFMDDMDQLSVSIGGNPSFFTNGYEQFTWSKLMDKRLGGEARLDLYVRALDQMSQNPYIPQLFRDIFKGAFLPYRDGETLNLFLKEANGFSYTHSEDLGDAYEYLLAIFASQGKAGQFRTPRHIIDFIVDCVNPGKDDTVLDPACGTAGFLISAYKHILQAQTQTLLSPDEKKRLTENLVGYDIAPDMVRLSQVNMYLHKFPNPTIHEYDTLTTEDRWDENFDVILANPPFMTPKGGIRPHKRFAVRANRSEVLFVDYIAEHLNPGGRAGVIVPEGIIFQSNNAYKALRKMLVEENYLYAVVSLPAGIFNPYSGVKTSILLMDKRLARQSDSVLFLKVAADGYDLGAQRREIERNDVPEVLRLMKVFQADPSAPLPEGGLAQVVSKRRLAEDGNYNLSSERYRENGVVNSQWPMVELGIILDYEQPTEYIVKSVDYSNDFPVPVLTPGKTFILGYTNEANGIYSKGLPVIIFDDFTTASRLVDFPFKVKSSAMKILHANNKLVNIKFAFYMMKRITFNNSTHKRYWISEYSKIPIPLPPLELQRDIVEEIEGYQKVIDGARQVVENYKPVIPIDPSWPTVRLKEVSHVNLETTDPKSAYRDSKFIYVDISSVENGTGRVHFNTQMDGQEAPSRARRVAKNGDVLLSTVRPNLKAFAFLNDIPDQVVFSTGFAVITPTKEIIGKFLYYLALNDYMQDQMIAQMGRGSYPSINQEDVNNLIVPLPSVEQQKKLVSEFSKVESTLDSLREMIDFLEGKIRNTVERVWK